MRKHYGFGTLYNFVNYYRTIHLWAVRRLWTWLFLLCVKLYVRLLIYLARRAVFRYIPIISMWLVYGYRVWLEKDPRLEGIECGEHIEMIPYHKMDWRVIKWTIVNTFNLGHVELDLDQGDDFGSLYEWFFHWTRPHLGEVGFRVKLPLVRPAQVGAAPIAGIDRIECFTEGIYVDLWENVYYVGIPLDPRLIGAYYGVGFYFVCYLVRCVRKYGDYMRLDYAEDQPIRPEGRPGRRRKDGLPNRDESARSSSVRHATWRVCTRNRPRLQRTPIWRLPKSRCIGLSVRRRLVGPCHDGGLRLFVHHRCYGNFLSLRK